MPDEGWGFRGRPSTPTGVNAVPAGLAIHPIRIKQLILTRALISSAK